MRVVCMHGEEEGANGKGKCQMRVCTHDVHFVNDSDRASPHLEHLHCPARLHAQHALIEPLVFLIGGAPQSHRACGEGEAVRGHPRSSEAIRGHQRSSEVIGGHQ